MKSKLSLSLLLLILAPHIAYSYNEQYTTTDWSVAGWAYGGYNYIPDGSTSAHVTGIQLGLTTNGAIYTVNIIGDGVTMRTVYSTNGCNSMSVTKHTL